MDSDKRLKFIERCLDEQKSNFEKRMRYDHYEHNTCITEALDQIDDLTILLRKLPDDPEKSVIVEYLSYVENYFENQILTVN